MATTIRLKRGTQSSVRSHSFQVAELGLDLDHNQLYAGIGESEPVILSSQYSGYVIPKSVFNQIQQINKNVYTKSGILTSTENISLNTNILNFDNTKLTVDGIILSMSSTYDLSDYSWLDEDSYSLIYLRMELVNIFTNSVYDKGNKSDTVYTWSNLTDNEKIQFLADVTNNIFVNDSGDFYQYQYEILADSDNNYLEDLGYTQDVNDNGLYYNDPYYAIPLLTRVPTYNRSFSHITNSPIEQYAQRIESDYYIESNNVGVSYGNISVIDGRVSIGENATWKIL